MAIGTPNKIGSGAYAGGAGDNDIDTDSLTPADNLTYIAVFVALSRSGAGRTATGMDASFDWGLTWAQVAEVIGTEITEATLSVYVASGTPIDGVLRMNYDADLLDGGNGWWVYEIDGTDRDIEDGVVLANTDTFENSASHSTVPLALAAFLDPTNNAAMHVGRGNASVRTISGWDTGWSEINDEAISSWRAYGGWRTGEDLAFDVVWSSVVGDSQAIAFELRAAPTGPPQTGLVRVEFT